MLGKNTYVLQIFTKQYSNQHTGYPYTRHVMTFTDNKENEAHKKAFSWLLDNFEEYKDSHYKGDYVDSAIELIEKTLLMSYATQEEVDEQGIQVDDLLLTSGLIES